MAQVKQVRTAAAYEKMVLTAHEWMVEQGYEPWAQVVEVEEKRYRLELLADDGVPRVPTLEGIIEFLIGMTTGEVEKGGNREARDQEWYASPAWGKSQAAMCMPLEKKGKYGWGPYKDLPYRLGRIEQHVTAMRQWLQEELRRAETPVANPMHDGWVDLAMEHIVRELGRGRDAANLPPILDDEVLEAMVQHADTASVEEVQTVTYTAVNTVHGTRAHDNEFLDRRDSTKQTSNASVGQRAGRKVRGGRRSNAARQRAAREPDHRARLSRGRARVARR